MSWVAGIDYSTHAVDVVLIDENDEYPPQWHRLPLASATLGDDAFGRTRCVLSAFKQRTSWIWDDVLAVGIEDPRGQNAGALYRIQGGILQAIPSSVLVQPWIPSQWRKAVGLPGNASKADVASESVRLLFHSGPGGFGYVDWPQDAHDAFCIALATLNAIEKKQAA